MCDLACDNIQDVYTLVTSACALHNMCILSSEEVAEYIERTADYNLNPKNYAPICRNAASGINKRAVIV